MIKISRRRFIRESFVVGAALTAFPTALTTESHAGNVDKIIVHPNIDNLRVVGITDNAMTRDINPNSSWNQQEKLVVPGVVSENIDKLACTLAKTGDPSKAWRTIFIKPPAKSWADTVVAIKTNNISRQHTRSAIMAKVCNTLVNVLRVRPNNIHIYDACHGSRMSRTTPFAGLPVGCRIENQWGGSAVDTNIPEPWKGGRSSSKCVKYLVDGSVDILVNISMCKGHSNHFGGFTMTMKNHFGTFSPGPGHSSGSLDYLIAINKTQEILGEIDKKTNRVLFPRQQLCIVDALWASKSGPSGNPSDQSNFIAMGVLSPVVDYLMATDFRQARMGWKPNMRVVGRFLSEFGYSEADMINGGKIIEV